MTAANTNLPALRSRLREQRTALRLHRALAETKANTRLLESWEYFGSLVDMPNRWTDNDRLLAPMGTLNDRRDGQNGPVVRTLEDLRLIRGLARVLCEINPIAIGFVSKMTNYIIGTGIDLRAAARQKKRAAELAGLVEKVQLVWDEFEERTEFKELQREVFGRTMVDGEAFERHYDLPDDPGYADIRIAEPEQCLTPVGHSQVGPYSFGIRNAPHDVCSPIQYFFAYKDTEDGANGVSGEYADACDVVHVKRNVPRNVKRGLSDFFTVQEDLENIRKLLRNLGITAGVQAAVAWFRQWASSQQQEIVNLQTNLADCDRPNLITGRDTFFQKVFPGQVIDAPTGMVMSGPPAGTGNVAGHVAVVQALLRAVSNLWDAPEFFTGDASNQNYASILVAGSPFVRRAKVEQEFYGTRFKRTGRYVVRCAVEAGRLPPEALDLVTFQPEAPAVEMEDKLQDAQRRDIECRNEVLSRQTWSAQSGYDPDEEAANIAAWKEANPGMGNPLALPPGFGGDPNSSQGREAA